MEKCCHAWNENSVSCSPRPFHPPTVVCATVRNPSDNDNGKTAKRKTVNECTTMGILTANDKLHFWSFWRWNERDIKNVKNEQFASLLFLATPCFTCWTMMVQWMTRGEGEENDFVWKVCAGECGRNLQVEISTSSWKFRVSNGGDLESGFSLVSPSLRVMKDDPHRSVWGSS